METVEEKRPIILIGTLPPPINGQAVAFNMLAQEVGGRRPVEIIDISERAGRRDRDFSLDRVFQILQLAASVWRKSRKARLMYLTIAQSRWGFIRDALLIWVARFAGCAVVVHLHGGNYAGFFNEEPFLIRVAIRATLRQVARIIVLSNSLKQDFAFLGSDRMGRIRIVPNGCITPVGTPRSLPSGSMHLLYLSNFLVQKGYLDCVDAMVELRRRLPSWKIKLTLAGSFMLGEDEYDNVADMDGALRKHIRYLELDDCIEVVGVVAGEQKQRLLANSDVLLLPTYYRNEGQPISLLEAMASGIPALVTPWRSMAEIVRDGVNGLLVAPQDPISIADAVVRLCNEPGVYERISKNAIVEIAQFSPLKHVEAMLGVFDEDHQTPDAGASTTGMRE
jgi:glycosyltransferase involved in cell wall biosynthesis